jgi:hypothetical protein
MKLRLEIPEGFRLQGIELHLAEKPIINLLKWKTLRNTINTRNFRANANGFPCAR